MKSVTAKLTKRYDYFKTYESVFSFNVKYESEKRLKDYY